MTAVILFSCNESKQETPKNTDWLSDNLSGNVEQITEMDKDGKPVKIVKRTITYYKE